MVSVSVCYLFYQPMDGKNKTWTLRFPAKETLTWRRYCSIDQSCCSMTSKQFLESSSGMKFVYPSVRLANQKPGVFVSVRYTNQIALFPFVCCFCFVRAFSFQGHTKIALIPTLGGSVVILMPTCRMEIGNSGCGLLLSHSLKSGWGSSTCSCSTSLSSCGIQLSDK